MIKLERIQKPEYLSDAKVLELTETFKATSSTVWNHPNIKDALLTSSHSKCAYCECSVFDESKYMEVEHFEYKDKYQDSVVYWPNLLPACKRCNIAKGSHDVRIEPILNPYDADPREHLSFRLYKLKGVSGVGKSTIDALDLNNSERLVLRRFEVAQQVENSISVATDRLISYEESQTNVRKNKLLGIMETILQECQPQAIYSATTATAVLTNEEFLQIIETMRTYNIWPEYLEHYLQNSLRLVLQSG